MAEEINLIVNVDKGNTKSVADVRKELEEAKKAATDTGKALGDGIAATETKTISLKAQLKAMKQELMGMDEGSAAFKKLSAEAGALEDRIGDVNARVKTLASDTRKLDAIVGVGSAITGSFQAAQGAMALFGSESKQVEKAIQNIIAAQGILNGVQQLGNFLTTEGIGKDIASAVAKNTLAARTTIATAAQKLYNLAVAANPIMLLVAAIGAVVGAFALFTKGANASAAGQKALNGAMIEGDKAAAKEEANIKVLTTTIFSNTASLKDKKKAIEDLNAISPEYLGNITLENIGTQESIASIKEYIGSIRTKIELQALEAQLQQTISERLEITRRIRNDEMELTDPSRLLFLKAEEDSILSLIQSRQTSNQELEKEVALKGTLEKAGGDSGKVEDRAKAAQSEADRLAEIERERLAQELEDQKRADEAKFEYETNVRAADFKIEEDLKAEKLRLEQEQFDAEFDMLEKSIDDDNAAKDAQEAKDKERNARRLQLAESYTKAVSDLTTSIFTLTNNLGKKDEASQLKRAKRQFEIKKLLDMAEAGIDGTKAVLSTFANTPGGLIIKSVAATAAGVIAAAKIAAIGSAKFEGGGFDSNVSADSNVGDAMQKTGEQQPKVQDLNNASTILNPEPQKVYVVESEMTAKQNKVKAIISEATF